MTVTSATIGLPVSDLQEAEKWYRRVFELTSPSVEPAPGVVEFVLGPIELQLSEESTERSGAQLVLRLGVDDAPAEYRRLTELGLSLGPLEHVEGAVDYFDFTDPDGNPLSLYSLA
ncbi:VOC family protein [Cryobacterium soli]|uniref:VOC family protein n=1 Tax=Cryobacterium soli TaxID=2220095 RepID=UPI0013C50B6D|nr:VOC family protein [Cryobacterium soli]